MEELIVDAENAAVFVDRRFDLVALLARMVGGDQVFAPVFNPFDRLLEVQRRGADQHVFRVHFAADAETAADVALMELNLVGRAPEHQRETIPVPVRDFGGAVHLQNVFGFVIAGDGAARFHRHAAVAPDR